MKIEADPNYNNAIVFDARNTSGPAQAQGPHLVTANND